RWTNFARVTEDENIVVGDAFNTSSGTWLAGLGSEQTLVITPPESHNPFEGDGVLVERSFRWEGPRTFSAGSPYAEFTRGGTARPGDFTLPAAVVAALGGVLVVVFLVARRQDVFERSPDGDQSPAVEDTSGQDDGAAPAPAPPEPTADEVDVELLSDEERVERLLEENGGRMKQATIVSETGWSNAKVSQLLSSMEEDGRIDKLRIGRENLISFPDEDVGELE
ncbi:MAG: helix-turn-helix transcriptional regulator, partial [Salinirussus sp.]